MQALLTDTNLPQQRQYQGFAGPLEGLDLAYLEMITVRYSRRVLRTFLNRFGASLKTSSPSLAALLEDWLGQSSHFEVAWHFAFGETRAALTIGSDAPDYLQRAVGLALHLHQTGLNGSWSLQLDRPARLVWGTWLLPTADHLDVWACNGLARLSLSYQGLTEHLYLERNSSGWQVGNSSGRSLLQLSSPASGISLWPRAALESQEFDDIRSQALPTMSPSVVEAYTAAFKVLKDYAPAYKEWVERVLVGIVPVEAGANVMLSGSSPFRPGVIYSSYHSTPLALAELLVHEATHQYCHLLQQLGKLDDGSDRTLYYSPVRRTGRPIGAIVITYHAFANMFLYYRMCRENGSADREYCLANEQMMQPQLHELETALRSSPALTTLGRALWEPLQGRISEGL